MRLDEVRNLNHEDEFIFAVAVGIEGDSLHCTILYKWEDGQIKTLDFWSNQFIRSERTIGDFGAKDYLYVLHNQEVIFEAFALQVPAVCELIKENNNRISFGIRHTDTKFDDNGKLIFANGDFGLTCATFILAVFQRAGINLINLNEWEVREADKIWHKKVLEYYKLKHQEDSQDYSEELLKHYEQNIGCFRYRPEEVAAATASPLLPTNYAYCNEFGERVNFAVQFGLDSYHKMYFQ